VPALLLVTDERGAFGAAGLNLRYAIALLTGAEWGANRPWNNGPRPLPAKSSRSPPAAFGQA